MTDIRKTLEDLGNVIESLANQPAPKPVINDRELSGNKINGGLITNFSSKGIKDEATEQVLTVRNDGLVVKSVHTQSIPNPLTVGGNLTVQGEIHATKLHVDEISADIRNERTTPLEFKGENGSAIGKGLIWTGGSYTKQLVLQGNPERLWSSEDFDLNRGKEYRIANQTVLSENTLGIGIVNSSLRKVGMLEELNVSGQVNIDNFVRYDADTQRVAIGGGEANGMLSMESWDHHFVIDPTDDKQWKIGTWSTSGLNIITDDTTRIAIGPNGGVSVKEKTSFEKGVGIGVKNFASDADLTVAGPVRFQNKKQEVGDGIPKTGSYLKGDIVWNSNPKPSGHVGWVCVREGTPGEWRPFGQIA
jgi:hypothetical protein